MDGVEQLIIVDIRALVELMTFSLTKSVWFFPSAGFYIFGVAKSDEARWSFVNYFNLGKRICLGESVKIEE